MQSFTVHLICAIIILVGAINWGSIGLFGINLVKSLNDVTFQNTSFEQMIYIIVGLAGLYMMFNRTYYLPFLGKTVMPPSAMQEHQINSNTAKTFELDNLDDANLVVYWAAKPSTSNEMAGPEKAYEDYSNYGVSKVVDGKATIKVECPQQYQVNKFGIMKKVLPKHVHYRTIHSNGIFSEIRTLDVSGSC